MINIYYTLCRWKFWSLVCNVIFYLQDIYYNIIICVFNTFKLYKYYRTLNAPQILTTAGHFRFSIRMLAIIEFIEIQGRLFDNDAPHSSFEGFYIFFLSIACLWLFGLFCKAMDCFTFRETFKILKTEFDIRSVKKSTFWDYTIIPISPPIRL